MDTLPDRALFTLTTDFGLEDPYVGQLKGALLKGCPSSTIIDLTHAIPAWDVVTAALTLHASYAFFPPGTIHLIVVDPGVGTQRSILVAAGDGHFFIAPDNGILSPLVVDRKIEAIHKVENSAFFSGSVSPTFHGRDIMAPVAAALARGHSLHEFGDSVSLEDLHLVLVPSVVPEVGRLHGRAHRIDHFGNIQTTIRLGVGSFNPAAFGFLEIRGRRINRFVRTYAEVEAGALLVLIDSSGFVEIASNQARAVDLLGCSLGDQVTVHLV